MIVWLLCECLVPLFWYYLQVCQLLGNSDQFISFSACKTLSLIFCSSQIKASHFSHTCSYSMGTGYWFWSTNSLYRVIRFHEGIYWMLAWPHLAFWKKKMGEDLDITPQNAKLCGGLWAIRNLGLLFMAFCKQLMFWSYSCRFLLSSLGRLVGFSFTEN